MESNIRSKPCSRRTGVEREEEGLDATTVVRLTKTYPINIVASSQVKTKSPVLAFLAGTRPSSFSDSKIAVLVTLRRGGQTKVLGTIGPVLLVAEASADSVSMVEATPEEASTPGAGTGGTPLSISHFWPSRLHFSHLNDRVGYSERRHLQWMAGSFRHRAQASFAYKTLDITETIGNKQRKRTIGVSTGGSTKSKTVMFPRTFERIATFLYCFICQGPSSSDKS